MNNFKNTNGSSDAMLSDEVTPIHTHDDDKAYWRGASGREYSVKDGLANVSQDMDPIVYECDEYSKLKNTSRRTILKGAGLGALLLASPITRMSFTANAAANNNNIVIAVFLRGGMDGLATVAPLGDSNYTRMRPKLGLNDSTLLPLSGGKFGIHPAMTNMQTMINNGDATVIHATGHPNLSRSHFSKQQLHEVGAAQATLRSGWLGRYLASTGDIPTFRAITMGSGSDFMLANPTSPTLSMTALGDYKLNSLSGSTVSETSNRLTKMWGGIEGLAEPLINQTINSALTASQYNKIGSSSMDIESGYGEAGGFGRQLHDIARMIKSGAPLEVACVDLDGWDMHGNMGDATDLKTYSILRAQLTVLDKALSAFWKDLGEHQSRVTILTMSEFGRTGSTNGENGADHGYGGLMFMVSKNMLGGVQGVWPGLNPSALEEGDLNIVNDYRDVAAEVLRKKMNVTPAQLSAIFPDYTPKNFNLWR